MSETTAQRPAPGRVARLIVTRPAAEAGHWVQALRDRGWPAQALPLIDIGDPATAEARAALQVWRTNWSQVDALLFVSGAAVSHFFAEGAVVRPLGPFNTRFWAPGPGTARQLAQALDALGIAPERIDAPPADAAQFDSEHLWPVVASQVVAGSRILIVRGSSTEAPTADGSVPGHGRDWLIRQCEALGARVEGCVAYERRPPVFDDADRALVAQATLAGSVWLFSSSEALAALRVAQPSASWAAALALVTHPRIAQAARDAGFGRVIESRPSLPDVLRALESECTAP
ncbi:uroporphyrinogen-III synthase [Hydrogenophaga sp.]|uniref:uroporphyrinogen-III synthase n=1 Tax=Hydrogenophaga sp. TaxID=1904254 RepID=UPI0027317F3C|nr:uroporphyrinogen-III synthase [Hydrogenophaga sp.]MDP2018160.1 uroporphyrinogen-III synthase [Hydrogenophaga sp.]MDP3166460.1 uroporphyrinogen-III synthase [Hydrogenophaga sp.]MDP3810007.1 uroporphyrinogen-III synthase [Hydrogenophaga sp.]